MRIDEPWSTFTAVAYLAAGVVGDLLVPFPKAAVFVPLMVALAVFTGLTHATGTRLASNLDRGTIVALFTALPLLAVGLPWFLILLLASGVGFYFPVFSGLPRVQIIPVIALPVLFTLVAAVLADPIMGTMGTALMGAGFWLWHRPGDLPHAGWHLMTAPGLLLLFLAIV